MSWTWNTCRRNRRWNYFGVAKGATVHGVKVNTGCTGQVPVQNALDGIDWVTEQLVTAQVNTAVTNMSFSFNLQGGIPADVPAFEQGIVDAVNAGVIVVTSAGNATGSDACQFSPNRMPEVVTVLSIGILCQAMAVEDQFIGGILVTPIDMFPEIIREMEETIC